MTNKPKSKKIGSKPLNVNEFAEAIDKFLQPIPTKDKVDKKG